VVVDRPEELEGERLRLEVVQERELLVELEELLVGPREEEVREVADVGEPEGSDLGLQLRVELAHPPHPRVLERVVPRRDEDVEAEHGLDPRASRRTRPIRSPVRAGRTGSPRADPNGVADAPILFAKLRIAETAGTVAAC
jgi:hypothetical protein